MHKERCLPEKVADSLALDEAVHGQIGEVVRCSFGLLPAVVFLGTRDTTGHYELVLGEATREFGEPFRAF